MVRPSRYVTSLETNVGIHITLGHITEPRNVTVISVILRWANNDGPPSWQQTNQQTVSLIIRHISGINPTGAFEARVMFEEDQWHIPVGRCAAWPEAGSLAPLTFIRRTSLPILGVRFVKQAHQIGVCSMEPDSRRSESRGLRFLSFSISRFNWQSTITGTPSSSAKPLMPLEISATSCWRLSDARRE